jgi:hypothetical protein
VADDVVASLKAQGIPASTWPDLPLEVLHNSEKYHHALWWRKHLVLLTIHQDMKGIEKIGDKLCSVCKELII